MFEHVFRRLSYYLYCACANGRLYHFATRDELRGKLLLIVDLTSKGANFPLGALQQVDSVLIASGFKKEVQSVVQPGKTFSVTYDGPNMEKTRIEEILKPVAERNQIAFSVDVEESVKFP
jgi:hypothetical protein